MWRYINSWWNYRRRLTVRHTTKELLTLNQWRACKWFQGNFNPEHRGTKMSDVSLRSFHRVNSGHRLVTAHPSSFIEASCFIFALFYVDVISKRVIDLIQVISSQPIQLLYFYSPGGGGVLPHKDLMGTCGQPGYVFRDFCLKQGIEFIIFCLNQGIDLSIFFLNRINVLNRVSKIGILS